jgi:predicted nucleic acid-binding protein
MKTRSTMLAAIIMFALTATLAVMLPTGCVSETPQQWAATGVYAAGYAVANDALTNGAAILPQLQDIASKLPSLNSATLTPAARGALTAELQNVQGQLTLLKGLVPTDTATLDNAEAFIAGVLQSNASLIGGRAPTADQMIASTALLDFANGLTDGISFWQGKQTISKP